MSDNRIKIIKAFGIVALSVAIYGFTLDGDFVFDDSEAVVKNKDVTGNSSFQLFFNDFWGNKIASNNSHKSYRPLTVLSFRLNYILNDHKLSAYQMKLTNLILNIICCILAWQSFIVISAPNALKNGNTLRYFNQPFCAALLFTAHPLHTEAVSGVVGRADILSGIFFFSAFLCYTCRVRRKRKWLTTLVAVSLSGLGMLFKEPGVTILGVCIILELLQAASKSKASNKNQIKLITNLKTSSLKRILVVTIGGILFMGLRMYVMGLKKPLFQDIDNPAAFAEDLFTRLSSHSYIHFLNFLLFIWPQWLCFDWSMGCIRLIEGIKDFRLVFIVAMYTFFGCALRFIIKERDIARKRHMALSLSMLVIPFLPAANIFFPVGFVIAERVLYIPSAGYCLLIAKGVENVACYYNRKYEKLVAFAYITLIVIFAARAHQRSYEWRTERTLFLSGYRVCPNNAKVSYNIAKVVADEGDIPKAMELYRQAISLNPKYYQAMNNLANLLKDKNKFEEAEKYLKTALSYKQDFPAAWMNLGIVLANLRRFAESEAAYLNAIHYRSVYPHCHYNLGNLYLEMREYERANECFRRAISQQPTLELAWSNLLALLDNQGGLNEAMQLLPSALELLPRSGSIHFVAGNLYGKSNNFHKAEEHFRIAIDYFGDKVQAVHYANLGVLYHRWKRPKEAEIMYKKALKINAHFKSAVENLSKLTNTNKIVT